MLSVVTEVVTSSHVITKYHERLFYPMVMDPPSSIAGINLEGRLEELNLIQYSLLSGEHITYLSPQWKDALEEYTVSGVSQFTNNPSGIECCLRVAIQANESEGTIDKINDSSRSVEVEVIFPGSLNLRGSCLPRAEQERLQRFARETLQELRSDVNVE